MKITINDKIVELTNSHTAKTIKEMFKNNADLVIINGFPVSLDEKVNNGDNIVLIKKGERPSFDEFESMMMARHTPEIHKKLKKSSVAIAGLGGLGSNAAVTLSRMGVGNIKIFDFDVVEPSNLNRQYYFVSQLGMKKTDALKDTIKNVNPFVNIETCDIFINEDNIKDNFNGFDVILECFDNEKSKAMFVTSVIKYFPQSYLIAVSGIAGIYPHTLFTTKKLGKSCIILGDFENEAKKGLGLMASRASIAANIQANIAIRYIVGEDNE